MDAAFDYERILYELKLISPNKYWNDYSIYSGISMYGLKHGYEC
jgi:hypothetical protein